MGSSLYLLRARSPILHPSPQPWPLCSASGDNGEMYSIHLEVHGRVQGVGFRWYVVEKAQQLKLAGWVRNKSDGKVEIAAAGELDALSSFEAAVKSGPRGARVEQVRSLSPVAVESLRTPFEIVR